MSPSPDGIGTLGGSEAPESRLKALSGLGINELWREAEADSVGLRKDELATVLLTLGVKYNYGLPLETVATPVEIVAFWRSLQLPDLALAHACALGRESAWKQFLAGYRDALIQAATAITLSVSEGRELADSLYADLFGLTGRGELRRVSPLAYYSGRGSLKGFLRATLAQRNIDRHRRTDRESPLTTEELPAAPSGAAPTMDTLALAQCGSRFPIRRPKPAKGACSSKCSTPRIGPS